MKFSKAYEPGNYESDIYAAWESSGVFTPKIKPIPTDDNSDGIDDKTGNDNKFFSIVMPPPNANGNLHIGHGLTVALEDSLTRFYRLNGYSTWYIPGADHAGFETWVVYERALEKEGHTRFEYSRDELYARVWDFVAEQRGNMELQLRSLGASCSWPDLTFTLDENVIDRAYSTFEKMWNDGLIYRDQKLVNFCPKHQTAFADIEVEHEDEPGHLWSIAYPVVDSEEEIIVSTTRPETLFGDTAIAVNEKDERYKNLIGKKVKVPLTDREIEIITDEHADPEYGTGAVKITPAHDFDDFEVGNRHNLERIQVIDETGHMINVPEKYLGLTTEECRKLVLKDLEAGNYLKNSEKITHSVAHCYKCGTVIEPMLKKQWFVDVKTLAKTAIEHLENDEIKFYPASKKEVLINYYKNLKDWNISRQIPWGIAIPMFRKTDDSATGAPEWIFDRRTNLSTIEVAGVTYARDEDTFDTWFSSAHWPIVCTDWNENYKNPYYPLSVMETGADILFAWVARMIMIGLYVTGEVPFKEVYLHGLVLDKNGQKMSKSKGNVVNPMDLVAKYGSDAFRLGILRGRSAGLNQAFSEDTVRSSRNLINKLWNISRLVESIVKESETENSKVETIADPVKSYTTENAGEDWLCRELNLCINAVSNNLKNYRFSEAVETLYDTIWNKYADWFIESQKLFKNIPLLKISLENLLIALHPFAPFVTEAIWQNLSWTDGLIMDQKWPQELKFDPFSASEFEKLMDIVSEIRRTSQALSEAKKWPLLYGDDSIVADNAELIKFLTKVPDIEPTNGSPKGLRLALANSELYLDVPEKVIKDYRDSLESRILSVGRELDILNARLMNSNYVDKAPAHLVKETREQAAEKSALIGRLKRELELI